MVPSGPEARNSPPGFGSATTRSAIQLFNCSGSVSKAKIVLGDASMRISKRTSPLLSAFVTFCSSPFDAFGYELQFAQARPPKVFDKFRKLLEPLFAHDIETLRPFSALVKKAGRTQHAEMLRDGRPCQLEVSSNRPS